MLEIRDIHVLRDGRSVIDTRGRRRFRVLERRIRDGYNVASVEFLKDVAVPLEQREGDYQQNNLNYYCTVGARIPNIRIPNPFDYRTF